MVTNYGFYFLVYIAVSAFISFYVVASVKSKKFIPDFLIVFWIMTFQIYASLHALHEVPKLGMLKGSYDIIALILLSILVLEFLSKNDKKIKKPLLSYEKYIFAYFILSLILIRIHGYLGNLTPYLTFFWTRLYTIGIVFYYVLSKIITRETIKAILKAIIFLGVLGSIISIYQFFVDSKFLRLASFYLAFGHYNRASGIFTWPYDNGLMMILSTSVTYFTVKNRSIKIILILLFLFTMILVFTRGVWLAFLGIILIHGYVFNSQKTKRFIFTSSIVGIIGYLLFNIYVTGVQLLTGSGWEERVFADTVTTRLVLYEFTLKAIPSKWLIGFGDYKNNPVYFEGMVNLNHGLHWALGYRGGIHNVILQEAFVRGIFPPIFLIIYFVKYFRHSFRESIRTRSYFFCIPNYFALSFFLYVFSTGEYLQSRTGYLTLLFFAMTAAVYHKDIDISDLTLSKVNVQPNSEVKNILEDAQKVILYNT